MRSTSRTRSLRSIAATILTVAAIAGGLAGCGARPLGREYDLHVTNSSTLDVDVRINGASHGVAAAGGSLDLPVAGNGLLPWSLELVSPSGVTLATATVTDGSVGCEGAGGACTTLAARAHLVCGDIVLWSGDMPPPIPPMAPGTGLPCD